jgi:hypothetical protein
MFTIVKVPPADDSYVGEDFDDFEDGNDDAAEASPADDLLITKVWFFLLPPSAYFV